MFSKRRVTANVTSGGVRRAPLDVCGMTQYSAPAKRTAWGLPECGVEEVVRRCAEEDVEEGSVKGIGER